MIIDWMGQKMTWLPHLLRREKEKYDLVQTRICGVLAHGQSPSEFAYVSAEHSGAANTTLTCLLNSIDCIAKGDWKNLPRRMYLQADNSGKENKNNHMNGFLAAMVQLNLFDTIETGFMLVGHTKEDVDQLFSRPAIKV